MNPFSIIFAITAIILIVSGFTALLAPSLGVVTPETPGFPDWASDLNWTVTLTDWSGIGSFFVFAGGIIVYFVTYLVWMVAMIGVFFTVLGASPMIATAISGLIFIAFTGSLLMFLRGTGGSSK